MHAIAKDNSITSPIIVDIKRYVGFFESISFLHVKRSENGTAHTLAKEGHCFLKARFWIEEASSVVEQIVEGERIFMLILRVFWFILALCFPLMAFVISCCLFIMISHLIPDFC